MTPRPDAERARLKDRSRWVRAGLQKARSDWADGPYARPRPIDVRLAEVRRRLRLRNPDA
jgi:hypothetical protein